MNLQEFVKNSLIQIMDAVAEARAENGGISPAEKRGADSNNKVGANYKTLHKVDFDVAVTTSSDSAIEGKAKGGIISVVSGGIDASISDSKQEVSRIKFSVPVQYDRSDA